MGEFNFTYEGSLYDLTVNLADILPDYARIWRTETESYIDIRNVIEMGDVSEEDEAFFRRAYEEALDVSFDDLIHDLNLRYTEHIYLKDGIFTYYYGGFETWIDNMTFYYDVNTRVLDQSFVVEWTERTREQLSGIEGLKIIDLEGLTYG